MYVMRNPGVGGKGTITVLQTAVQKAFTFIDFDSHKRKRQEHASRRFFFSLSLFTKSKQIEQEQTSHWLSQCRGAASRHVDRQQDGLDGVESIHPFCQVVKTYCRSTLC